MASGQHPFQSGLGGPGGVPGGNPGMMMRTQYAGGGQMGGMMVPGQANHSPGPETYAAMLAQQQYGQQIQPQPPQSVQQQQLPQQPMQQQQVQSQPQAMQPSPQQQVQQQQQQANQQVSQISANQQNQQQPQQPAQPKEYNTASLCRIGQETVQDILSITQEVFQILKVIQPPNGETQSANMSIERKNKVQEKLRNIQLLFRRLRIVYNKCNENCQGMEYTHIESLIPLKEDLDVKSDEKKNTEAYRAAAEENKELTEQVILKNRQLKEIIDHLRRIIWEINTMLAMRRP